MDELSAGREPHVGRRRCVGRDRSRRRRDAIVTSDRRDIERLVSSLKEEVAIVAI
jgi:hypothetical protein